MRLRHATAIFGFLGELVGPVAGVLTYNNGIAWSAGKLLDVLYATRKDQLHPSLLTSKQLEPIFRDFQNHFPRLGFLVPEPRGTVENLSQMVTITIICKNEIIKILLDFPLVDGTD